MSPARNRLTSLLRYETIAGTNTLRVVLCAVVGAASSFLLAQENEATKETTLPPEVEQLYARYETSMATLQNPLLELRQSYARKLEELKAVSQAQGDLAAVVAVQDELKQQAEAGPGIGSRLASLAGVQKVYHEHAVKIENRLNPERIRIEKAYQTELAAMIAKLTQEGKIEEALQSQKRLDASNVRMQEWQRLSAEWDRRHASVDFAFSWPTLRQMIQENRLVRTSPVGGAAGDLDIEIPQEGALLVGFEMHLGPFGISDNTVRKILPLYRTESGRVIEGKARANATTDRKRREIAKPGYVVAGITTHSEAGIRKMKIRYEAIRGMATNPEDHYESNWYGEWEGGRVATLSTEGKLPVGLEGAFGLGVGETKLIVLDRE